MAMKCQPPREKTTFEMRALYRRCVSWSWLHHEDLLNTKTVIKMEGFWRFSAWTSYAIFNWNLCRVLNLKQTDGQMSLCLNSFIFCTECKKCTKIANVRKCANVQSVLIGFELKSQFACQAIHVASPVLSLRAAEFAFCLSVCLSVRVAAGDDMFASVWIWLSWQPETL